MSESLSEVIAEMFGEGEIADQAKFYLSRQLESFLEASAESWIAGLKGEDGYYVEDAYETGKALRYMMEETIAGNANGVTGVTIQ